jgi:hypothetical protein
LPSPVPLVKLATPPFARSNRLAAMLGGANQSRDPQLLELLMAKLRSSKRGKA